MNQPREPYRPSYGAGAQPPRPTPARTHQQPETPMAGPNQQAPGQIPSPQGQYPPPQQVPGGQHPAGQPAYPSGVPQSVPSGVVPPAGGMMAGPGAPQNYLWLTLAASFCFGMPPISWFALYESTQVNKLWAQGRYTEAKKASDMARNMALISIAIGVVLSVLLVLVLGVGAAA